MVFSNGNIQYAGKSFASSDIDAAAFLKFVDATLRAAGWISSTNLAGIRFQATALNQGDKFFGPIGLPIIIWDPNNITPPPVGFVVVNLASTNLGTAQNLIGPLVTLAGGTSGTTTPSGGFVNLQINGITGGSDNLGNNITMSVFPTGSVGIWDYSPAVGSGLSYGGGYIWTSAIFIGLPMIFKGTKPAAVGVLFTEPLSAEILDSFNFANSIQILANQYQTFIFIPGLYGGGTFFQAGHLFPLGGLTNFNYFNGSAVHTGGGNRNSGFNSLCGGNPVVNGVAVSALNLSIQLPGFVGGNAELNLIRDANSLNGRSQGLFYDPIITNSASGIGALYWDAYLISVAPPMDSLSSFGAYAKNNELVLINSVNASQTGGALCVLTQNFGGAQTFPNQLDSNFKGDDALGDLLGPSALINVINPLTGKIPGTTPNVYSDYAF